MCTNSFLKDKDFYKLKELFNSNVENPFTPTGLRKAIMKDILQQLELILEIIDFDQKVDNNVKKYETFIVASETEDSIYSPTIEDLITVLTKGKGQIFISKDRFEEIVNQIIDPIWRLNN